MSPVVEPRIENEQATPAVDVRTNSADLALTVLAVLAVIAALKLAEVILVPVALALLISYALEPAVALLARAHVPRGLGAALLMAALCGGLVVGGYGLRGQVTSFLDQLPDMAHRVGQALKARNAMSPVGNVQKAAGELERAATTATQPMAASSSVRRVEVQQPAVNVRDYLVIGSIGIAGLVAQIVVVVFLALYLLAADDIFKRKLVHIVGPSLNAKKITLQILKDIDRQIAIFLLVRLAVSAIVGVATWLGLVLVGLDNALLWGVAAGVLNVVPYLGPTVIAVAVAVAGLLQFDTMWMAGLASGSTIAVSALEGYWLTPWLTSRAAQMNSVAVFVGLLFWGWLWGVWGMLLAVPLMMVMKAVCDRIEDLQPIGELLGE